MGTFMLLVDGLIRMAAIKAAKWLAVTVLAILVKYLLAN